MSPLNIVPDIELVQMPAAVAIPAFEPLPKRLTFTVGFLGSLEGILIDALLLPVDVGANVPVIVHEPPAAIVVQLFV